MGNKTLVVPDLHTHWEEAEDVIKDVAPDEVVFLGDYFDDYDADSEANRKAGEWLRDSLQQSNRLHLWGNHDIHYAYPWLACSGWSDSSYRKLYGVFGPDTWKGLYWFAWVDGWLCTHAGLHPGWLPEGLDGRRGRLPVKRWLDQEVIEATRCLYERHHHWFWTAGRARGGRARAGGLLWQDWTYEFRPVRKLNQIMGHTHDKEARRKDSYLDHSTNVCLAAPGVYGLVRSGTLTILTPQGERRWDPVSPSSMVLP